MFGIDQMNICIAVTSEFSLAGSYRSHRFQVRCYPGLDGDAKQLHFGRLTRRREELNSIAASDWRVLVADAHVIRRWQPRFVHEHLVVAIASRIEHGEPVDSPTAMTLLILDAACGLLPAPEGTVAEVLQTKMPEIGTGKMEGWVTLGAAPNQSLSRRPRVSLGYTA